jgi:hypothetical protein
VEVGGKWESSLGDISASELGLALGSDSELNIRQLNPGNLTGGRSLMPTIIVL